MHEQASYGQTAPHMRALAYLYDNLSDLPIWVQQLTPGQMEQLAALLNRWQTSNGECEAVQPIAKVEKHEFIRALVACRGDVGAAAKALGIGKTTLYRRLKEWGYGPSNWRLICQATALAGVRPRTEVRVSSARAGGI